MIMIYLFEETTKNRAHRQSFFFSCPHYQHYWLNCQDYHAGYIDILFSSIIFILQASVITSFFKNRVNDNKKHCFGQWLWSPDPLTLGGGSSKGQEVVQGWEQLLNWLDQMIMRIISISFPQSRLSTKPPPQINSTHDPGLNLSLCF